MTEQRFDATVPNVARVYDYLLGGKDHFPADRDFAARLMAARPDTQMTIRENRRFLGRVVTWLGEAGVRQFLDLGTGLPTSENVHQVAQRANPDTRIVYVDNDPAVVAHSRALLAQPSRNVAVVHADLRDPAAIFDARQTRELIDWTQPVAILMLAVLHFVPDADQPHDLVAQYVARLPHGGYLALSHAELRTGVDEIASLYTAQASSAAQARTPQHINEFFGGLVLVEPGLVPVSSWRPSVTRADVNPWFLGGVGVKP